MTRLRSLLLLLIIQIWCRKSNLWNLNLTGGVAFAAFVGVNRQELPSFTIRLSQQLHNDNSYRRTTRCFEFQVKGGLGAPGKADQPSTMAPSGGRLW